MAILSSHLLNSVTGEHAANVEITIFKFDENNQTKKIIDTNTDSGGRILEEFKIDEKDKFCEFEMVIKLRIILKIKILKIG